MKINAEIVQKLNPCESRFNNFKSNYPSFDGDLVEFLKLDKITYNDKVWVVTRLFTKEQSIRWGALCAESVLHIFEEKHPEDKRPRRAVKAAPKGRVTKKILDGAHAASAAAHAADAAHADYAVYAAVVAAYYAVYAAYYAASARVAAGDAAAWAAYAANAANNREEQQDLNLLFMLEV